MIVVLGKPVERWKCTYEVCNALCCKMEREIMPKDIEKIAQVTGRRVDNFVVVSDEESSIPFKLKRINDKCIFLLDDLRCELHDLNAKPILCQMYPFLIQKITYGDEPIMYINPVPECPGYGIGPNLDKETLDQIVKKGQIFIDEIRKIAQFRLKGKRPEEILKEISNR
ncbi:MAG: YkgJ family cysteine cluster protein [Nitrososphaerales archaeon]